MATRMPAVPYRSLGEIIGGHSARRGDKAYAISIETGYQLTYAALDAITSRIGHFLAERGLQAGDRVAIMSENCLSQVALFLGVQRYGVTAVLVNCEVNEKNVGQILHDVDPRLILWHRDLPSELQALAKAQGVEQHAFADDPEAGSGNSFFSLIARYPERRSEGPVGTPLDIAVINYTSGTTDRPRGVCCSHEWYFYVHDSATLGFDIREGDRVLEYRALTWLSPQNLAMMPALHAGASFVLARKFSGSQFFGWIKKYGASISAGVPASIAMLLERPHPVTRADLPSLRYMTTSTAPIAPETYEAFQRQYGIPLVQACGMSEAGFMFCNDPGAPRRGTVGKPLRNLIARFVDENGNETPPGVEGELVVEGPQVFSGYLTGRGQIQPRPPGAFRTGDLGYFDREGYVFLTGRKKELIIKGGVKISPLEITSYLCEHPAVLDAATVGVPDKIYGEAVACFVVPKPGASLTAEVLLEHLKTRLSEFKMPSSVTLLNAIPKTARQKVSTEALVNHWQENVLPGQAGP